MKTWALTLCILFTSSLTVVCQNQYYNPHYKKGWEWEQQEYFTKAIPHYERARLEALERRDTLLAAHAGLRAAVCDLHKYDFPKALKRLPEVLSFFKTKTGEKSGEYADALYRYGVAWSQKGFLEKGNSYFFAAEKIFKSMENDSMLSKTYHQLSENAICYPDKRMWLDMAWGSLNKLPKKAPIDELTLLIADAFYFNSLGHNKKFQEAVDKAKSILFAQDSSSFFICQKFVALYAYFELDERGEIMEKLSNCYTAKLGEKSIRMAQLHILKSYSRTEDSEKILNIAEQIIKDSLNDDIMMRARVLSAKESISKGNQVYSSQSVQDKLEIIDLFKYTDYGPNPQLWSLWEQTAEGYANMGNFENALYYWNKAKNAYESLCGHECLQVSDILRQMAFALGKYYENPDTIDFNYNEALRIAKKAAGDESSLLTSLFYPKVIDQMMAKGSFKEALPYLIDLDSTLIKQHGREYFERFRSLFNLYFCYINLGDYVKARDKVGHEIIFLSEYAPSNAKRVFLTKGYYIVFQYYLITNQQDSAMYYLDKVMETCELGEFSSVLYRNGAAEYYFQLGNWPKYREYIYEAKKGLEQYKTVGIDSPQEETDLYEGLARYYMRAGQCDSSLYYINLCEDLSKNMYLPKSHEMFNLRWLKFNISYSCQNNTGEKYTTEAERLLEEALEMYAPDHLSVVMFQSVISSFYQLSGNYETRNHYLEKVVDTFKKRMEINPGAIEFELAYLEKLGEYLETVGNSDEATQVFKNALERATSEGSKKYMATFSNKLAGIFEIRGDYMQAEIYAEKAVSNQTKNGHDELDQFALAQIKLGNIFQNQEKWNEAEPLFLSAEKIADTISVNAVNRATTYHSCSKFFETLGHYQKASELIKKAIGLFETDENKKIQGGIFSGKFLASYYMTLAGINRKWHEADGNKQRLREALVATEKMLAYTNEFNENFSGAEEDQLAAQADAANMYHEAMLVKLAAGAPLEEIWTLSEMGKSATLRSKINAQKAMLSDDGLNGLELAIRQKDAEIANIEKARFEFIERAKKVGTDVQPILTEGLAQAKKERSGLLEQLKSNSPEAYKARFDLSVITLPEVKSMLTDSQSLLSYSFSDSTAVACLVNRDTAFAIPIRLDGQMKEWMKNISGELRKDQLNFSIYIPAAHGLYANLVQPFEPYLKERLVIVPNGETYKLPFEVLLKSESFGLSEGDEGKLDYLLKHHDISYQNSATLWQEMKNRQLPEREGQFDIVAFAPSYTGSEDYAFNRGLDTADYRQGLRPLKNNEPEAREIVAMSENGKAYTGPDATELAFINNMPDARIGHFSGHAKAFDGKGDFSFMAFHEIKDSTENEWLYAREIYPLSLPLEMMVISGCESGLGTLNNGEGIIGLGRSLSYAGAKSMVISLWSVNDESTKDLMVAFYRYLHQGWTKDWALRQAKLDLMGQGKAPYFWAPFVLFGEQEKVY